MSTEFFSNSTTSLAPSKQLSLDNFFARSDQIEFLKTCLLSTNDEDHTTGMDASAMSMSYSSFSVMSGSGDSRGSTRGRRKRKSNAQLVYVTGAAGVGKTALLMKAVQAAERGLEKDDNPLLFGDARFDSRTSPVEAIQSCVDTIVKNIQQAGDLKCRCCNQQPQTKETDDGEHEEGEGEDGDDPQCECLGQLLLNMEADHKDLLQVLVPSTSRLFSPKDDSDCHLDDQEDAASISLLETITAEQQEEDDNEGEHVDASTKNFSANNKDALVQLQVALKSLFRALSQRRRVVLLFDDLHRAPADSFDLLGAIATDIEASNLVLCGTYRDKEVTPELKKFQRKLSSRLRTNSIHSLHVGNFSAREVKLMMSELLDSSGDDELTEELSTLIHQRTAGNIFFIKQLLESIQQENMIQFDWMSGKWKCDINLVQQQTAVSENVLEVVVHKIQRLDPQVQSLLQLCACLGSSKVSVEWVEICLPAFYQVEEEASRHYTKLLEVACAEKMLDDLGNGWFKFSHDMVQESVRLLLPKGQEQAELHWTLGRLLFEHIDAEGCLAVKCKLKFLCADLINMGVAGVSPEEKESLDIAKLNLEAAKSANKMSAFHPACQYCQAGINSLGNQPSVDGDHGIVLLDLYVLYAEMLHCTGDFNEAKKYCELVFEQSTFEDHKVPCYITMMQVLNAEAKNEEAVVFGLGALKALGEAIPKKLNKFDSAFEKSKGSKTWISCKDEDVLSLPLMKNERKAACIQVMQCMLTPLTHLSKSDLCTRILKRMMTLTLKYGLTEWAPEAFAIAGADLVARKDDLDQGYRLGKLALALIDRLQAKSVRGRVCWWTTIFTFWWKEPLTNCLDICIDGYRCGMGYGDTHFAFYNIIAYALAYFYSGLPLKPLLDDLDKYCHQMIEYRQYMVLFSIIPCWQVTLNLCGEQPSGPLDMTKGLAVDKQDIAGNDQKVGEQATWSFLMQISFYLGDIEQAAMLADRLEDLDLGLFCAQVFYPTRVFFFSLIAIEQYRTTRKRKFKQKAKKHADLISKWISSGALNLTHKGLILRAELSSISSKTTPEKSQSLYDKAFSTAMRCGFLQDAALTCQLAAAFCEQDLPEYAVPYAVKAFDNWQAWDAVVVASHIEKKYPEIFGGSGSLGSSMGSSQHSERSSERGSRRSRFGAYKGRPRFSFTSSRRHLDIVSQEFHNSDH